ncbi:hypothetical protein L3Y34_006840 [Caenorhabditis briggsae]|uniref:Uncharacterized protein n=1 Tax=Caenorhabditis briggsae TaxID=6238 RepID=A0AAE8ZXR4_CAEBR|nr:hypothetical protein L3Y34_006840 [Caenorhabditis briggsae]
MDTTSMEYFREEMQYRYDWNISELPALILLAYDPSNGMVRWRNVSGIANSFYIVTTLYGIMMFCGWSMYQRMEEKIQNFSEELKKHQKQFFKALCLQITAPTMVLFTPVFVIILLPFFDLPVSIPSGPFLGLFTLYPAMDSLIVMYVVSQYRQTARKLYQDFRKALESFKRARATVHYAVPKLSEPYYYGTCIDLLDRFPFEKTAKIILQPQLLTLNYLKTHMADKDYVLENYHLDIKDLPRLEMTPLDANGLRLKNVSFMIAGLLIMFIHYFVILYCGLRMNHNIRDALNNMSQGQQKLQRQFFRALVIQSLGPTIFLILPVAPIFAMPFVSFYLDIAIGVKTGWLYSLVGLFPPFDSISFMWIVSEYRRVIKNKLLLLINTIPESPRNTSQMKVIDKN